jgi:hypothetical protein
MSLKTASMIGSFSKLSSSHSVSAKLRAQSLALAPTWHARIAINSCNVVASDTPATFQWLASLLKSLTFILFEFFIESTCRTSGSGSPTTFMTMPWCSMRVGAYGMTCQS